MIGEQTTRPDFRILSHPDVEAWKDYFREILENNDLNLSVICQDIRTVQHTVEELCNCSVVVIILSPSMLTTMVDNAASIATRLNNHPCVTVIRISTSSEDFDRHIKTNYPSSHSWHVFEISVDKEDDNRHMIAKIIDLFDCERTRRKPCPPKPRAACRKSTSTTKTVDRPKVIKPIVEMVCPDCIRKAEEKVLVIFREEVAGTVQVSFKDDAAKLDTKKINPFCYRFNAPAHKAGRTKLNIYIDGKKSGHSWPFRYESPTHSAYQGPAFLSQLMGLDDTDPTALDNQLTAMYKESVPNDESLAHILTPKAMSNTSISAVSEHQFPTLLHFAAFYGLQELCAAILETPGACRAFDVMNKGQLNPYDLAREQGHDDIAEYMDSFMELQLYVQDYEAMYEHMGLSYTNVVPAAAHDDVGYLLLPYVENTTGGFTDTDESGYVVGNLQEDIVSEVRPEDDVRVPDIPVRNSPTVTTPPARKPERPPPLSSLHTSTQVTCGTRTPPLKDQKQLETPEEFFAVPSPVSPHAMGSRSVDELYQMQQAFKEGDFTIDEVERLFHSWKDRNRDASVSMKERKKKLNEIKEKHETLIRTVDKRCNEEWKKKTGFFSRFSKKKSKQPTYTIEIEHSVGNQYTSVPSLKPDRMSIISNTSTISSSSSSSHDSALGPIEEFTDSEPEEFAPPVPRRDYSMRETSQVNRRSLGKQFLDSTRQQSTSRLPPPPPVPASRRPPVRRSSDHEVLPPHHPRPSI